MKVTEFNSIIRLLLVFCLYYWRSRMLLNSLSCYRRNQSLLVIFF